MCVCVCVCVYAYVGARIRVCGYVSACLCCLWYRKERNVTTNNGHTTLHAADGCIENREESILTVVMETVETAENILCCQCL